MKQKKRNEALNTWLHMVKKKRTRKKGGKEKGLSMKEERTREKRKGMINSTT